MRYLFLACAFVIANLGAQTAAAAADSAALAVVNDYMTALLDGDTQKMNGRLGKRMKGERKRVMDNPGYAKELRKAYRGAKYKVIESEQTGPDTASVLVQIKLRNDDLVHVRFELTGGPQYEIATEG